MTDSDKQEIFFKAYEKCGRPEVAAREAGISPTSHYRWLKNSDYAIRFRELEQRTPKAPARERDYARHRLSNRERRRPLLRTFLDHYKALGAGLPKTRRLILAAKNANLSLLQVRRWLKLDPELQKEFTNLCLELEQSAQSVLLNAYKKGRTIHEAAKEAGVCWTRHYWWLKTDSKYKRDFEAACEYLRVNPPPPRTYQKSGRPKGLGSRPIPIHRGTEIIGYKLSRLGTRPDGSRGPIRKQLLGVTERQAWEQMLKDVEGDRPLHGPLRDGPPPSIDSILNPQPRSPERLKTVPPRNGKRTRHGDGYSIIRGRCSVALLWWDAQGEPHRKNIGQVSDEEADRLGKELVKPIRERVIQAQALAKSRYRETLKKALQPSLFGTATSQFPDRAKWLRVEMKKRDWSKHDIQRLGGPSYHTIQKILDGRPVYGNSLETLARTLSKKLAEVIEKDIPET